jgi:hypothetical protein
LFHGTIESFDKRNIRGGGYDKIFWTTDSPAIAQTYIAAYGSKTHTSIHTISKPSKQEWVRNFQKSIGLNYDYDNIKFDGNRIDSYGFKLPKPLKYLWDKYESYDTQIKDLNNQKVELENQRNNSDDKEERREILKKLYYIEKEIEETYRIKFKNTPENILNKYVLSKIKLYGYDISTPQNLILYIDYKEQKLKNVNDRSKGKLLIIKPKRDMLFYDMTYGGAIEGDLMDVDYHKIDTFRVLEEKGYDGVKINDYAQSSNQGNYGHLSYGFFNHALKDLEVKDIRDVIHRDIEYGEDLTPEYINYTSKKK